MTYEIITANDGAQSIRCLICDHVSHNPNDIATHYCGFCNIFHEAPAGTRPGATGRNVGQLGPQDEGELAAAFSVEHGFIVLRFGKPVTWLSIEPERARMLARLLIMKADEIEGNKAW